MRAIDPVSGPSAATPGGWRERLRPRRWEGLALLSPAAVVLVLVVAYPLLRAIQLSISRFKLTEGIDSERLCGLCNFQAIVADPFLGTYLRNQVVWVAGTATLPVVAALALALLLDREVRLRWLWRAIVLVPWMMPLATIAVTWRWIYDQQWGLLNQLVTDPASTGDNIGFLTGTATLWPAILVVTTWMWFPYNYVAILAALQGINPELYEAGRVDGTNAWTAFRHITFPSLRPLLALLVILGIIWSMNDFTTIWLLTQGGPGIDSTTLGPLVFKTSFRFYDLGKGAAFGILMMVASLAFALVYLRRTRGEEPA